MFQGSMVALVTPMHDDNSLDREALKRLVEFHFDNGTEAIVAVGTTGESPTLDFDEHCEVIKLTVTYARGRIPVIAGTGANSTSEAIELTRCAKEAGAHACLVVTPYYNKPTQEGLYRHHRAIAEAVAIPQILYNVPGRTACDMLPETVARLADVPNIIGIKEATGKVERVRQVRQQSNEAFEIYSGEDSVALDSMLEGARGVISVTANVAPRLMQQMCAAARAGDEAQARTIDQKLAALHKSLFVETNPIPVKWALKAMGMINGGIRLPLTPLADQHHETVGAALRAVGALA
jgi:4-hydroxy-tetrahydrodipicolinate synthase